jgi:hypothetical protein
MFQVQQPQSPCVASVLWCCLLPLPPIPPRSPCVVSGLWCLLLPLPLHPRCPCVASALWCCLLPLPPIPPRSPCVASSLWCPLQPPLLHPRSPCVASALWCPLPPQLLHPRSPCVASALWCPLLPPLLPPRSPCVASALWFSLLPPPLHPRRPGVASALWCPLPPQLLPPRSPCVASALWCPLPPPLLPPLSPCVVSALWCPLPPPPLHPRSPCVAGALWCPLPGPLLGLPLLQPRSQRGPPLPPRVGQLLYRLWDLPLPRVLRQRVLHQRSLAPRPQQNRPPSLPQSPPLHQPLQRGPRATGATSSKLRLIQEMMTATVVVRPCLGVQIPASRLRNPQELRTWQLLWRLLLQHPHSPRLLAHNPQGMDPPRQLLVLALVSRRLVRSPAVRPRWHRQRRAHRCSPQRVAPLHPVLLSPVCPPQLPVHSPLERPQSTYQQPSQAQLSVPHPATPVTVDQLLGLPPHGRQTLQRTAAALCQPGCPQYPPGPRGSRRVFPLFPPRLSVVVPQLGLQLHLPRQPQLQLLLHAPLPPAPPPTRLNSKHRFLPLQPRLPALPPPMLHRPNCLPWSPQQRRRPHLLQYPSITGHGGDPSLQL